MKQTLLIATLTILLMASTSVSRAQNCDGECKNIVAMENLKAYPESIDSLVRRVVILPVMENEEMYKVEIIVGKSMLVDCNRHVLIGEFVTEDVQGWGYSYHKFITEGHVMSTMKFCPEPKEMKFVSAEGKIVRYNSKLPVVVYLPADMELRYRIWSAGEEMTVENEM